MEALYVHFIQPTKNNKLKELQLKLNMKQSTLSQLSDTRWVCRFKSCDTVINIYEVIIKTLNEEIADQNSRNVAQAIGMYLIMN